MNKKIIIVFIIIVIAAPICVNFFIIGNGILSNANNDAWTSFFGSYFGAIIGGICTCWAVVMQKEYSDRQRQSDELMKIRPFLVAENPVSFGSDNNISVVFDIHNMGMQAALNIGVFAINYDVKDAEIQIDQNTYFLSPDEKVTIKSEYNFNDTFYYQFRFMDLKSNLYHQDFRYDKKNNRFISIEPKYIQNIKLSDYD